MWYPAKVITPATSEPVTLQQAKDHCRVSANDMSRDGQLDLWIKSARAAVETYCGIRLMPQTIEIECDGFQDFRRLSQAPLKELESISYFDPSGAVQTLDPAIYEAHADGLSPSIGLRPGKIWPVALAGARIKVRAEIGYDDVPFDIVAALLLSIGKLLSFSRADLLLRSEEVDGVGSTTYAGAVDVTATIDGQVRDLLENYRNWAL